MGKALTSLPRSCEADIRDLSLSAAAKEGEKKKSVSWGGRAGGAPSPPSKLARGKVPGFSEVHLLSCAASAAMSVVILHFSF